MTRHQGGSRLQCRLLPPPKKRRGRPYRRRHGPPRLTPMEGTTPHPPPRPPATAARAFPLLSFLELRRPQAATARRTMALKPLRSGPFPPSCRATWHRPQHCRVTLPTGGRQGRVVLGGRQNPPPGEHRRRKRRSPRRRRFSCRVRHPADAARHVPSATATVLRSLTQQPASRCVSRSTNYTPRKIRNVMPCT